MLQILSQTLPRGFPYPAMVVKQVSRLWDDSVFIVLGTTSVTHVTYGIWVI